MGREWLILSPRCKPGSLAHLFRSFTKQAFSAGICFSPLFLFFFFFAHLHLGRFHKRKVSHFCLTNSCTFRCCTALASFYGRGGSQIFLEGHYWILEQNAIRVVLSQQSAKHQATVTQGGGHTSVTPHRYAGKQEGWSLLRATHRIWHFNGWRPRPLAKHGATIITRSVRRRTDPLWEGIRKRKHSKCIDRWISLET